MKKFIKQFIRKYLRYNINKFTDKEDVLELIELLKPYNSTHGYIRLGPDYDGGYVLPNNLSNIKACFSPGVDKISEFELDCYNKYGMQLFLADKSVDKPNLNLQDNQYEFIKKFVGSFTSESYISLDSWVKTRIGSSDADLLLQMDIEGAEYDTIIGTSEDVLKQFRIIIIEFHNLDKLWDRTFYSFARKTFMKILESFYCVHIHPNNNDIIDNINGIPIPRTMEFTFIRKDCDNVSTKSHNFPHPLDFDNEKKKSIQLPSIWFE